jgi:hypothetical protein
MSSHEAMVAKSVPVKRRSRKRGTLRVSVVDRQLVFDWIREKPIQGELGEFRNVSRLNLEEVVAAVQADHLLRLTTCRTIPMKPRGRRKKKRPNTALISQAAKWIGEWGGADHEPSPDAWV